MKQTVELTKKELELIKSLAGHLIFIHGAMNNRLNLTRKLYRLIDKKLASLEFLDH